MNVVGLEFVEADKVLILLRALPQPFRQWVVLNAPNESFQTYVDCALRYEAQQRIWSDLNGKPIASLSGFDHIRARGRTKGRKGKVLKRKEGRIMPILAKEKDQDQRHAPASTAMSEAISPSIVRRSRKEEKGSATRDPKEKERERGRRKVRKERKVRRVQKVNPRGRGPQNFHNSRSLRLEVRFGLNLMLRKVAVCRCSHPHPKLNAPIHRRP